MPRSVRAIMFVVAVAALMGPLGTPASRAADAEDLLAPAALVPEDVTLYLHVEDARSIARQHARRPIARFFAERLTSSELELAWGRLAEQAGRGRQQLFDEWLGQRVTLVLRERAEGSDWALITVVDRAAAAEAMRRLNPRRLAPRATLPVVELPEHGLLVASDDTTLLIGPTQPAVLFNEVVRLVGTAGARRTRATLAAHPALVKARDLGGGQAALFAQHGAGLGGWSVAVAELRGRELRVRHAARFVHPLFKRPVPTRAFDIAPLAALEDASLMAVIEPTEIGPGGLEAFAEMVLGEPLLSREMRGTMGDVRILAVGEIEGRRTQPPADLLLPAAAVAIKLADGAGAGAEKALDEHVLRLARALNRLAEPGATVTVPAAGALAPGQPRTIDLDPMMARVSPDMPLLRSVTLNWSVASGACGSFWVVATDPEHLGQTVAALESVDAPRRVGRWANCGTMNGQRLGIHLRTYSDQADNLAAAGPEDAAAFRETLLLLSDMAGGLERCRWKLRRPARREMHLDVEAILREPESAEPGKNEDD